MSRASIASLRMPAKKKKAKPKEKTPKEEVIETTEVEPSEVSDEKPSKKPPKYVTVEKTEDASETGEAGKQATEDKDKKKEEPEAEVKTITSFSQLDAKKPSKVKEAKEEEGEAEEEGKKEAIKEEKAEEAARRDKISADEVKKWISDAKPEPLDEGKKGPRINLKFLLLFVGIAAISGVVVGGVIYFNSRVSKEPVKETVEEPTPIPEVEMVKEEEEMVEEEVNLGEFSARVLNGAGIPGEAAKVKSTLADAGLEEIDTGNADSYDYEKTEVSLKESTPEGVYKAIEEALSGGYDVTKSETPLSDDSEYDVEVVVGTRK